MPMLRPRTSGAGRQVPLTTRQASMVVSILGRPRESSLMCEGTKLRTK